MPLVDAGIVEHARQSVEQGLAAAEQFTAKALGVGISGLSWRDLEVANDARGAPSLRLHGGAAERLAAITPAGREARLHLSLTDDPPYAMAFVVIEALARDDLPA